jgi:di/tricarboxylate transporter
MNATQIGLVLLLLAILAGFVWGRFRHDIVAFTGLMVAVLTGIVPADSAFTGLSHTATVSVAAMLVLTKGLTDSGATSYLVDLVGRCTSTVTRHVASLAAVTALLSTVMNNVGALALTMPVAMQTAARTDRSPSLLLMPISFAALLGGLVTLIGTPPNIIAAAFREGAQGESFHMFDFTWVGLPVALAGIAFISTIGWRLLPAERRRAVGLEAFFHIGDYVTEIRVAEKNPLLGKSIGEVADQFAELDVAILGLLRNERRVPNVPRRFQLMAGDVLIVEASPTNLPKLIERFQLAIGGEEPTPVSLLSNEDVRLAEVVIKPGSELDGRSAGRSRLAQQFNVNLLAVAREGNPTRDRLDRIVLRAGDVLLLQGETERLAEVTRLLGCLPLAQRKLQVVQSSKAIPTLVIFGTAILLTSAGLLPLPIALGCAIVGIVGIGVIQPRELYDAIDWPVIILLASMIPIGDALQTTGFTAVIAETIAAQSAHYGAVVALLMVFLVTMLATDILNNAATVVIMAPIGMGVAQALGASPDTFLMAVAIGGSSAFLTPIGHQNNTLIMGPGGYNFGDYWRMGLPLQVIIVATAMPLLLYFWPLTPG